MSSSAILLSAVLVLAGSAPGTAWASPRKHHPWFSHTKQDSETPSVDATPTKAQDPSKIPLGPASERATIPSVKQARKRHGVSRDDGNATGKRVTRQALRYEGTRYKYGGTTQKGMDCSGLISRVWSDLKLKKVPRVSSALYQSGRPVHQEELRPGDLVFFKNTYKRGISHVGVYAGHNKFVHAAGKSKGVTIAKLSDPYYQLHYAGARRLY